MTPAQLHVLRAERAHIQDLLADILAAEERLVFDGISMVKAGADPGQRGLIALAFAHSVLGNSMRFRAEQNLL